MGRMSPEQRIEAVVLKNHGQSYQQIAVHLGVSRLAIINLVKKHRNTGSVKDLTGRGRKRSTTIHQDWQLVRRSLSNRRLNSSELTEVIEQTGNVVSSRTVRRRLKEAGLSGRVACKKPLLSQANRKARYQFARDHLSWSVDQWRQVL